MTDYIKREDAIEALGEEPYVWSDTDVEIAEHAQWVSDVKAIEAVPSADVVARDCYDRLLAENDELRKVRPVVRGRWYGEADGYADGELVYDMWSCPFCGKRFEEWDDEPTWNYCPNCGADMRHPDD